MMNQTAIDTYTAAGDETVRMRHLKNGDLQIMTKDGRTILDLIPKADLDRYVPEDTDGEPSAECRGFILGMLLSSCLWVGSFFLMKWIAGA